MQTAVLVSSSQRKLRLLLCEDIGHLPTPHSDPGRPESTSPWAGVTRAGARWGGVPHPSSALPPPPHPHPTPVGRQDPRPLDCGVTALLASASYPVKWSVVFKGCFFLPSCQTMLWRYWGCTGWHLEVSGWGPHNAWVLLPQSPLAFLGGALGNSGQTGDRALGPWVAGVQQDLWDN